MPRHARWFALASALALLSGVRPAAAAVSLQDTHHRDGRTTPRIRFDPEWTGAPGQSGEALVRAYLEERAADYELPADLAGLVLTRTRKSQLGTHYTFQQQIGSIDVDRAELIVSVARDDGRIYRVFNNTYPVKTEPALGRAAAISEEAAYEAAWQRLRAHGRLQAAPAARLVWIPEKSDFRLTWIVNLDLSAPYGGWEVQVDAASGRVLSTRDAHIYRIRDEITEAPLADRVDSWAGPVADRGTEFARFEAASAVGRSAGLRASGTGTVFDPDPRTTLQDDNLQDTSPSSAFTAAYFTRPLQDITLSAGVYSLTGPWVSIIDWDTPSTAPSTTTTGNWTAVRGNNAFNDAMTYYQIDQSQRYMQSLGFTGATGIQEGSIGVDTDGFQGADNSFYQPSSNRLSFGHGCVDDSEDADVMLHEYGHAINYGINSSWGGGDMGAMGEGFGDYWAGSYSYSTLHGDTYHPEWVFSWDGHGAGNLCWSGRIMNAFGAQYDSTTTYSAHSGIPGGYQSDELWSTPLFQTLLDLTALSYPREDVDTIILEAQFGLGSGVTMRGMANAIIQTATTMFPAGPHADEFVQNFLVHNIVNIPVVSLAAADPSLVSAGSNGAADPGETVTFRIDVQNEGTLGATAVSAVLSTTTPGVVINQGASAYPDLGPGVSGTNLTDYSITLPPGHTCGDPVDLSLLVSFDDGAPNSSNVAAQMGTGIPIGASVSVSPGLAIPDNNPAGVVSQLVVSGTGANITANLNVDVNITHTYQGDLIVTLRSPKGTPVLLHDRTGGSTNDIIGNYPLTLTPEQSLATLVGEPLDGPWQLEVSDNAGIDVGTLNSWGINDVSGYNCDTATDVAGLAALPVSFALQSASPNPFGPSTAIRFAVPGRGADVSLEVFDVAGRHVRMLVDGFRAAGTHTATWTGVNDAGQRVGAGVYFYRLEADDFRATRKVMLLK
jgi:subtilisin-like proprotein convertase family protein